MSVSFTRLGKFSSITSSNNFFCPILSLLPSRTPITQTLICLILSQRSLKLSSIFFLIFFSFCYSDWVISTLLSSRLLIHSSVSLLYRIFHFSYCIFSYEYFLLMFSNPLLMFIHSSFTEFTHSSPEFSEHFMTIALNSLSGKLLISISLFPPHTHPGFYLVLSFGTYSSVSSFCLTCYICFYELVKTTTSCFLEVVAWCGRIPCVDYTHIHVWA